VTTILHRLRHIVNADGISRHVLVLVAGRTLGFVAAFAIPVVLARAFDRAAFGTYKQLFLVYATLYGLAQIGAAESLYYFVPRKPEEAGRRVGNAVVLLLLMGVVCAVGLWQARFAIAGWLSNDALIPTLPWLGAYLALMLVASAFEIVMVSRKEHTVGACTYAATDFARTALFLAPALVFRSLGAVLAGGVAFAALRVAAMLGYFWREFGREFRVDGRLLRNQLAYALPFALAVGIEVVQANYHQWAVAARFDAATFAIYAVGCLQIPLIDLVYTSTSNVMMVKMAEVAHETGRGALELWHGATVRLASLFFPLAAFLLLAAHSIIVLLFTNAYEASVPVFVVWCLMILPAAFCVDGVLRVYAQTRFLLVMNIVRLAVVALLIGWSVSTFGMIGAVLVTLAGTTLVKALALLRIARLMEVGMADVLPWKRLLALGAHAAGAAAPAWALSRLVVVHPLVTLMTSGVVYVVAFAAIWYARIAWDRRGTLAPICAGSQV
jgi:O-antigen/teichoic acid export membrane protein